MDDVNLNELHTNFISIRLNFYDLKTTAAFVRNTIRYKNYSFEKFPMKFSFFGVEINKSMNGKYQVINEVNLIQLQWGEVRSTSTFESNFKNCIYGNVDVDEESGYRTRSLRSVLLPLLLLFTKTQTQTQILKLSVNGHVQLVMAWIIEFSASRS